MCTYVDHYCLKTPTIYLRDMNHYSNISFHMCTYVDHYATPTINLTDMNHYSNIPYSEM